MKGIVLICTLLGGFMSFDLLAGLCRIGNVAGEWSMGTAIGEARGTIGTFSLTSTQDKAKSSMELLEKLKITVDINSLKVTQSKWVADATKGYKGPEQNLQAIKDFYNGTDVKAVTKSLDITNKSI
ncbi:MAG: hypothetical protein KBD63_04320, partial [Bacteriovoracaceae bacterium]|nr:hypothetical protein [Bacteriovoracaceae bacterium]